MCCGFSRFRRQRVNSAAADTRYPIPDTPLNENQSETNETSPFLERKVLTYKCNVDGKCNVQCKNVWMGKRWKAQFLVEVFWSGSSFKREPFLKGIGQWAGARYHRGQKLSVFDSSDQISIWFNQLICVLQLLQRFLFVEMVFGDRSVGRLVGFFFSSVKRWTSNVYHWFDGNECGVLPKIVMEKGALNSVADDKNKNEFENEMKFHRREKQKWETSIDIALIRFMLYVFDHDVQWILNKWMKWNENVSIWTLFGQVKTSVFIADTF